jgi:DNA-binding response OmpR family regulator
MSTPYGPILIVEDIPNILTLLETTLQLNGYKTATARNGKEALDYIACQRPALVITDILMPKLDGFSLVQCLRCEPRTSSIPIIFLSATYVTPEDKFFAMSLGAVRFLEKPVDTEEFVLTVGEVLSIGPATIPRPLGEKEFHQCYRERLEYKLHHKLSQIHRTERLLETLPEDKRSPFQSLLKEARRDRSEIEAELGHLDSPTGRFLNQL